MEKGAKGTWKNEKVHKVSQTRASPPSTRSTAGWGLPA